MIEKPQDWVAAQFPVEAPLRRPLIADHKGIQIAQKKAAA